MRSRILGAGLALLLLAAAGRADTGTYEIRKYSVRLSVREDGVAEIAYAQTWKVTGGHVPWITVGAANRGFEILSDRLSGSAARIRSANGSGWSGVRIDLDRDYRPGEEFEVGFAILQRGLFHAAGSERYRLDFVPGWYDRARTGELTIRIEMFRDLTGAKARPAPEATEPRALEWRRSDLRPGGRLRVRVEVPRDLFPAPIELGESTRSGRSGSAGPIAVVLVAVLGGFLLVMFLAFHRGGYGRGGRIGRNRGYRSIGGCVVSCACACVACACACACAGGGAAGCDRKLRHECPLCRDCESPDCRIRAGQEEVATGTGKS